MSNKKTLVLREYLGRIKTWPTGHRLLIKPFTVDDMKETEEGWTTKSGFLVPETAASHMNRVQKSNHRGVVVAVGINAFSDFSSGQHWFQPGDEVYFARHAGAWIKDELAKESFVIMDETDCIGVNNLIPPGWTKEDYEEYING